MSANRIYETRLRFSNDKSQESHQSYVKLNVVSVLSYQVLFATGMICIAEMQCLSALVDEGSHRAEHVAFSMGIIPAVHESLDWGLWR